MLQLIKRNSHVTFLFSVVILLSFIFTIRLGDPVEYITIVVENGDSIWQYANEYEELHNMPSDNFVSWVIAENDLSSTNIRPGEELVLPIDKSALADE